MTDSLGALTQKNQLLEAEIRRLLKVEIELRSQAEATYSVLKNIPDNIMKHDLAGRILYVNPQMEKTLRMNSSDLIGNIVYDIFPKEQYPTIEPYQTALADVISTSTPREVELVVPITDLYSQIHNILLVPEFNNNGHIHTVISVGRDITHIKEMENELRKQESEYRTLADNFPYFLVRYDTRFRRVYANKIYAQTLGVDVETVLNKSIDEVWSTNNMDVKEFKLHLHRVINNKLPENFFLRWVDLHGQDNFWEMYLVPEFDVKGNVSTVLGIGHETNMYKKAISDLNNLNAQLQALTTKRETAREEERKHIAQEIHDDLGQLLSVLHLQASMIDYSYGKNNPDLHTRLEKIMGIANQGIETIRTLITQLRPVAFDYGFIYACECLVADFSRNTGITCEFEIKNSGDRLEKESDLQEPISLIAFRVLQEALTNIMRHAKASKVQIFLFFDVNDLILKINDNGEGFNVNGDHRDNAFGLVGMKERMATLQGELDIISQLGIGTEIRIRIPLDLK